MQRYLICHVHHLEALHIILRGTTQVTAEFATEYIDTDITEKNIVRHIEISNLLALTSMIMVI